MPIRNRDEFLRSLKKAITFTHKKLSNEGSDPALDFILTQLEGIQREVITNSVPPKGPKREVGLAHTAIHEFDDDDGYSTLLCHIEDYYHRSA